jgi:sulfate permease, SulP family
MASMTSGVTVLLTPLVLVPLFSDLPKTVLAAVITEAVVMGMINVPEMRLLARVQRFGFWIAITAILATLIFGVLTGVIIGIALPLLWLAVSTRPNIVVLGNERGTQVYRGISTHPDDEQHSGIAIVRRRQPLLRHGRCSRGSDPRGHSLLERTHGIGPGL